MDKDDHRDRLIDMLLKELVGKESPPHLKEKILARLDSEYTSESVVPFNVAATPSLSSQSSSGSVFKKLIALAAVLTVLATPAYFYYQSIVQERTPRIVYNSKLSNSKENLFYAGASLENSTNEEIILIWKDGTKATVGVGAKLVSTREGFLSAKKSFLLKSGDVFVEVTKQKKGQPMTITTNHSVTEVLGTSFSLSAGKEKTRIEVNTGKIRFTSKSENSSLLLTRGTFAEAILDEKTVYGQITSEEIKSELIGFTLMNAETDEPIFHELITNGSTIALSSLPTDKISLRADYVGEKPWRVEFDVKRSNGGPTNLPKIGQGAQHHAPFFVAGDYSGSKRPFDCRPWTPAIGFYEITAIAEYRAHGKIRKGNPCKLDIRFKR